MSLVVRRTSYAHNLSSRYCGRARPAMEIDVPGAIKRRLFLLDGCFYPLTGYRVAVVSASPIWVVGSAQNRFGIEECRYWTDSAGRAIPWPATRVKQPGDKQHCYTRFRLGQASLSIPLPPIDLAFLAGFAAVVFGCFPILHFIRGRAQKHHVRMKV